MCIQQSSINSVTYYIVAYKTTLYITLSSIFVQQLKPSKRRQSTYRAILHPMMNHEPDNYLCPFCDWLRGNETEYKQNSDIVLQDAYVTAFISPKWWINNPGHVIVIPNQHTENIYNINDEILQRIAIVTKHIAIAMKAAYNCTGTSIRQHNEPDGNQDVWHYHTHVFPRYQNDNLYENHQNKRFVLPTERRPYAKRLRQYFSDHPLK